MISKWYHLNEPVNVCHRNTLVFCTNTLIQILTDSKKQNNCIIFRLLWELFITVKNSTCVQCLFLLQNAHWKSLFSADGDRFTFTICSHFRRTGIVVPLYSHATKSTPITHLITHNTKNHTHTIRPTSSDKTQLFLTQTHAQAHP